MLVFLEAIIFYWNFVCNPRSKEFNNIAVITGTKTQQIYDADEMLYRETYSGMFIT